MNRADEPVPVSAPSPVAITGAVALTGTPEVAIAATPTVAVANSQSTPLFVAEVADAVEPFQFERRPVFELGSSRTSQELLTVPEGKLLVIQYVSAEAEFRGDDRIVVAHLATIVNGARAGHNIEIDHALRTSGSQTMVSTLTQEMTVYADAGTPIRINMERSPAGERAVIAVTVSGYLLDQPAAPADD